MCMTLSSPRKRPTTVSTTTRPLQGTGQKPRALFFLARSRQGTHQSDCLALLPCDRATCLFSLCHTPKGRAPQKSLQAGQQMLRGAGGQTHLRTRHIRRIRHLTACQEGQRAARRTCRAGAGLQALPGICPSPGPRTSLHVSTSTQSLHRFRGNRPSFSRQPLASRKGRLFGQPLHEGTGICPTRSLS